MPATLSFFDMSVSVTPPNGYLQPQPLTLGANWQPNDVRMLFVSGSESASGGIAEALRLKPDPPTGFTGSYVLSPNFETRGVYYRKLLKGDADTSVAWIKPPGWLDFMFSLVTARGVDPGTAPVAGDLTGLMSHQVGAVSLNINSVTVPAAGDMVFCVWTIADPEGSWPSWASSLGLPAGWSNMVATDKSGATYYATDTNPGITIIGKRFASSGSTGTVAVPINPGSHAFAGMYVFLRPAPDVSASIGAA